MAKQLEGLLGKEKQLKAIAKSPRCEHGRIDEHEWPVEVPGVNKPLYDWCEGAPELLALISALTKENPK